MALNLAPTQRSVFPDWCQLVKEQSELILTAEVPALLGSQLPAWCDSTLDQELFFWWKLYGTTLETASVAALDADLLQNLQQLTADGAGHEPYSKNRDCKEANSGETSSIEMSVDNVPSNNVRMKEWKNK